MEFGKVLKRSETDYVVQVVEEGSGYNVVPQERDPYNLYTIAQVEEYLKEHPENLLA